VADAEVSRLRVGTGAWLLASVVPLTVVGALVPAWPGWVTGVIAWTACALFWCDMPPRQRAIVLALVGVGAAGIVWGTVAGQEGLIARGLAQNIPLTGMLVAVSFLQLVTTAPGAGEEKLETGKRALASTLAGVHLFGAVINYSAVAIFADRLSARRALSLDQAVGLSQSFIVGALWSPFYGAMAVAITFAPGASLLTLMSVGIPLTAVGVAITYFTLASERHGGARDFAGYPVRLEALWVPFVLAVGVLAIHALQPAWSVLAIIALLAPAVTAVVLVARRGSAAPALMAELVRTRIPRMGGEMALFLAAGVLAAGMAGMIGALDLGMPFTRFGGLEAALVCAVIVFAAWAGLHPVIFVAVIGPWLAPLAPDQNLFAMVFLMAWAVGLPACPMSNTVLSLSARYGIPAGRLLARNRIFSLQMLALGAAVLVAYARLVT
jgi:hypothetical protein